MIYGEQYVLTGQKHVKNHWTSPKSKFLNIVVLVDEVLCFFKKGKILKILADTYFDGRPRLWKASIKIYFDFDWEVKAIRARLVKTSRDPHSSIWWRHIWPHSDPIPDWSGKWLHEKVFLNAYFVIVKSQIFKFLDLSLRFNNFWSLINAPNSVYLTKLGV